MSEQEQPLHGGSYTRQPDGSLVRNEEPAPAKDAEAAPRAPRQKSSKEK
ncbi:hypothetical protein ABH994_001673 [Bradyrhizobium yuanmingense]